MDLSSFAYDWTKNTKIRFQSNFRKSKISHIYSKVKNNSADLGVNFKIVQNRPTFKAVCTKISKKIFAYLSTFSYF